MTPRVRLGALFVAALIAGFLLWRGPDRAGDPGSAPPARRPAAIAADRIPPSGAALPAVGADPHPPSAARPAASVLETRRGEAVAKAAAFQDWITIFRRADDPAAAPLIATGVALARARREALKVLIETDPKLALEWALPVGLRTELPATVQAHLEERVDARGDFEVSFACFGPETRIERTVAVAGRRYQAKVFGRRLSVATKQAMPVHGIALDGVLALDETPFRWLDDTEKAARQIPLEQAAVWVGAEVVTPATQAEFAALRTRLEDVEATPGPVFSPAGRTTEQVAPDTGDPVGRIPATAAVTSPPSWINGVKRVLWLRLEFADDPGAPVPETDLTTSATAVNEFYLGASHGKTSMTFVAAPGLIRLSRDKAYYNNALSSTGELRDDAKAAAKAYDAANGGTGAYDPDKYDRWIMVFKKVPAYTFGGLGNLGGPVVWLNGSAGAGVTGHELGHNHSLDHSHAWLPSSSSAIGPGTHVEYGDVFDRMGSSGSSANNFFNVTQKAKLGYLDATSITTVTTAGTYRLTRHDHQDAAGVRALRVGAGNVEYEYWIEHRRLGPTALTAQQLDRLQNGVILHWGPQKLPKFVPGPGAYLLDLTPGSAGGVNDAPLRIGETFTDPDSGITVRPLAVGGTAPNEYIDVEISFGATGTNNNPVLVADAPAATVNARTNLTFAASATDPDGDPVYYRWDFGDRSLQPNLGTVSNRFLKGGTYPVNVSAHDGRGGIAVRSYNLTVADPLTAWTRRAGGLTPNALYEVTYGGGRFVAVGLNSTLLTSPDGVTWSRQTLPTGIHLTGVVYNAGRFVASGYRLSSPGDRGLVVYSDDGVTWTTVNIASGLAQFWRIAFGAGRYVVVGDSGNIHSSADGVTWTSSSVAITSTLRAVTYADGLFVVSGDSGRVFTSPDGLTWTNRTVANTNSFPGVARYNNLWYIFNGSIIYSSPDASTWTRVTSSTVLNLAAIKGTTIGGLLIGGYSEGRIQFTENGQTWANVQLDATAGATIRGFAAGAGTLVAVGSPGLIYTTAAPAASNPPLPAPALRLEADSLKLSVGRKNIIAAGGTGYSRLELYANGTRVSEITGQSGFFTWTPSAIGNYALTIRGVNTDGTSAVSTAYPAQAAFADWNWRNPGPVGADLNGAVRVDGKWWIVGSTGTFFTLDTAGVFAPVDFSTTQRLTSIAHANGRFVVTAVFNDAAAREDIGAIWTSTDGYNWTALLTTSLEAINLNHVTYAGGQWVALSTNGIVLISNDGLTWARQSTPVSNSLTSAAYGNNGYVVTGLAGKIITSPDGIRWTERTSGVTTDLRGVAFQNGTFFAAGAGGVILTSTDGVTWTRRTSGVTANLYAVAAVKGGFVVGGDSGILLGSADGATWTAASTGGRVSNVLFAAGAEGEGLLICREGEVYSADTLSVWRRRSTGTNDSRFAVTYAGGKFVAVGQAADARAGGATVTPISYSTDGATWTRATAPGATGNLNDVTYANGRFVAVGDSSRTFYSTDGQTWTQGTLGIASTLTCVAGGPANFVAGSSGSAIYSSADGSTWTQRVNGLSATFRGAAYGNGRFVLVGDAGVVFSSADGLTFARGTSGVTANLLNVSWFEDVGFIAAGAGGTMIGSADGLSWHTIETGVTDTINAIAQTPAGFVAPAGTAGTMLLSLDGVNWSIGTIPVDRTIRGVAASATTVVAVGDNGATLSYDLVDATPAPTILAQPVAQALLPGSAARFSVTAQNATAGAYQWFKDGTPLVGANGPTLLLAATGVANLGNYTVTIATPTGTVTSAAAALLFANAANPGRLVNLSLLTSIDAPGDSFTLGFVVGGSGTTGAKPLVIRAAGPSLGALGVGGTLDDPRLELFAGSTRAGANDNWGGSANLAAAIAAVGAFPYTGPLSKDAALAADVTARDSSVTVSAANNGTGLVIAELYDATPPAAFTVSTPRLVNVSVLKHLGTGVTAGFVIGGSGARNVLIRAVGPTLGAAPFGVAGVVADPQLALYNGQSKVAENDNWGGTAALTAAFNQVGAFALPAASRDAALVVNLQPGSYTVQVSGVANTTGIALIEVYEVP